MGKFDLRELVIDFEEKLTQAVRQKYSAQNSDLPPEHQELFLRSNSILNFDLLAFYDAYCASTVPPIYLPKLIHALFDMKLELFYIGEIDMGLYNTLLYSQGYDPEHPTPLQSIKKMSLDQTIIVKNRILWERMINFASIYLTGDEITSKRSKKAKFAELIEGTPWAFLKGYWETLEWFDDHLRTPEVHSGSVLRRYFQSTDDALDDQKLIVLYNIAINLFYPNIMAIARGQEPPYKVWTLGMVEPPEKA